MGLKQRVDRTKDRLAQEQDSIEPGQNSQKHSFPAIEQTSGKKADTVRKILVKIDPARCRPWKYHNRNEWWLTSERSEALVDSITKQGQMQPGIVRRIENDPDYDYEIIFGLRRWYACSLANIKYTAETTSADDNTCARMMLDENEQSQDVSELEKCFSMADQVALFGTAAELARQLNLTKQIVGRRLSAARLRDYPGVMALLTPVITGVSLQRAKDLIDYIEQDTRTAKWVNTLASELQAPSASGKTLSDSMDQAKSLAPKIIDSLMKTDSKGSQADRPRTTTYLTNKKGKPVASMSESRGKVTVTLDITKLNQLKETTTVDSDKMLNTLFNDLKGYFDDE